MLPNGASRSPLRTAMWLANLLGLLLVLSPRYINSAFFPGTDKHLASQTTAGVEYYWNVPTFLCQRHDINFEPTLKRFGITVNPGDRFRGSEIIILYDPGMFPTYFRNTKSKTITQLNGGAPHKGDLNKHLAAFGDAIEKAVPEGFAGLGVIDFESWRPIFRQNWNDQVIYKEELIKDVKKQHPTYSERKVMDTAKEVFERSSRKFIEETLKKVKDLRPNAKWGYYGYPYCYNHKPKERQDCPEIVKKENNELRWLFEKSDAFFPSLYLDKSQSAEEHVKAMIGRLNELFRVANYVATNDRLVPGYPYISYKYNNNNNNNDEKLSPSDMYNTFLLTLYYPTGGAVIWGSSNDVSSKEKCRDLHKYVTDTLGPSLIKAKENFLKNNYTLMLGATT